MRLHPVEIWSGRLATLGAALVAALLALAPVGAAAGDFARETALGSEDAPVTIIEFASLTCPHCAHFHEATFPGLKEKYIDTGKVRFIFRDFPLDQAALYASIVARCAGPERFFGFLEILFSRQPVWVNNEYRVNLARIAKLGGIGAEAFEACMKNKELGDFILQGRQDALKEYEISATPTFIINGKSYSGSLPLEQFDQILGDLLP